MNDKDWKKLGKKVIKLVEETMEKIMEKTVESPKGTVIDHVPEKLYETKTGTKIGSILLMMLGYGGGLLLSLWVLVILFGASIVGDGSLGLIFMAIAALPITGCVFAAYKGTSIQQRLTRFERYIRLIGGNEYCNIDQLAQKTGKSVKFVTKDVEKMIQNNWFCQGHLDKTKTCLMVTDRMYAEYQRLEAKKAQQRLEELERQQKEQQEAQNRQQNEAHRKDSLRKEQKEQQMRRKKLSPEVQKVIEQGDNYVRRIRACNDAIPGEVISRKIDHMEMLVDNIFDRIEQRPDQVPDIRKLLDYYLPTTMKLLEAYAEMDAQPIGGDNIQSAKQEIEASLDTINAAFEKLLDNLFQDTALNVSVDISVLNMMLAQEGLKDDGLRMR